LSRQFWGAFSKQIIVFHVCFLLSILKLKFCVFCLSGNYVIDLAVVTVLAWLILIPHL
jgi:hypothetical protein